MKAIIIGAGSTIYDKNHLKILSQSDFDGYVMPCDRILRYALEQGVTPLKFPHYYTATINDLVTTEKWNIMEMFFNHEIIKKYAQNIKCFMSSRVHPSQKDYLSSLGILIAGYYCPKESDTLYPSIINQQVMEFEDCDDVSIALWNFARKMFRCSEIALLGVDHSYSKYDLDLFKGKSPSRDKALSCALELFGRTEVKTYNCTEGGRLYGPAIINSTLENFLKS